MAAVIARLPRGARRTTGSPLNGTLPLPPPTLTYSSGAVPPISTSALRQQTQIRCLNRSNACVLKNPSKAPSCETLQKFKTPLNTLRLALLTMPRVTAPSTCLYPRESLYERKIFPNQRTKIRQLHSLEDSISRRRSMLSVN